MSSLVPPSMDEPDSRLPLKAPTDPTEAIELVQLLNAKIAQLRAENWNVSVHGGYEDVPVSISLCRQAAGVPEVQP